MPVLIEKAHISLVENSHFERQLLLMQYLFYQIPSTFLFDKIIHERRQQVNYLLFRA